MGRSRWQRSPSVPNPNRDSRLHSVTHTSPSTRTTNYLCHQDFLQIRRPLSALRRPEGSMWASWPRRGGAAAAAAAVSRATCARGPRADVLDAARARARHHASQFPPGPTIPALAQGVVHQHGKAVRAPRAAVRRRGVAARRADAFICSEATRCMCGGATIFLGPPLRHEAAAAKASNVSPLPRSRPPPAAYAATAPQPSPLSPARSPPPTPSPSQPPPSLSPRPTAVTAASFAAAPVQPLTFHAPPPPSAPP